jgi:hypothetical protein
LKTINKKKGGVRFKQTRKKVVNKK